MPTPIRLLLDDVALSGTLHDTPLARAVLAALPVEGVPRRFGASVYVETPVDEPLEDGATDRVLVGDLAYWPPALAVALYFGPTPESAPGSERPVAASEVTVIGRVEDAARLRGLPDARWLRVERA